MGEEIINLMVEGGAAKAGAALGMKLGPLGLNLGKITQDINEKTQGFKGIQVPVKVIVDTKTKEYSITVGTPPAPQLIKARGKIEKGSGTAGTQTVGNVNMSDLAEIAKSKLSSSISKSPKAVLKQVVGTCISMGVTVDGRKPQELNAEIDAGKYDNLLGL